MAKQPSLDANYVPGAHWWVKRQNLIITACVVMYLAFYATIVFLPPQGRDAPDAGVASKVSGP